MLKEDLKRELQELNITKKEFANLANIPYNTVNNWSDSKRPIPSWVDSWLKNYTYKQKFEDVQIVLKKIKV